MRVSLVTFIIPHPDNSLFFNTHNQSKPQTKQREIPLTPAPSREQAVATSSAENRAAREIRRQCSREKNSRIIINCPPPAERSGTGAKFTGESINQFYPVARISFH